VGEEVGGRPEPVDPVHLSLANLQAATDGFELARAKAVELDRLSLPAERIPRRGIARDG